MPTFTIESNGRLENTAIYYNGQQMGGIKEIFLNLDEEGTFDAIIQYEGTDKEIHNKSLFNEYLTNAKFVEPTLTEEEAENLVQFTVESDGDIENTELFINEEFVDGIVSAFVHIKGVENKKGLKSWFSHKSNIPDIPEFRAELTFRNENGTLGVEGIF